MQVRNIAGIVCCLAMPVTAGVAAAASLSHADQHFMVVAAKVDMTAAHASQIAEHQAKRPEVKTLAQTLVQDHTTSYSDLSELTTQTGASIPKGIDVARYQSIERLAHLKGASFDRQFIADEIAAQRRALAIFRLEAKRGENPAVKAYAAKMIPVLEKDLHLGEHCMKPARRV
ncbi:MAG TPA: DUF4142 domain-containing protein [Bryobacteraceae bacterium]|nr:DUF4142 domain-containing protein [Bryobacteraceae bacterium]